MSHRLPVSTPSQVLHRQLHTLQLHNLFREQNKCHRGVSNAPYLRLL